MQLTIAHLQQGKASKLRGKDQVVLWRVSILLNWQQTHPWRWRNKIHSWRQRLLWRSWHRRPLDPNSRWAQRSFDSCKPLCSYLSRLVFIIALRSTRITTSTLFACSRRIQNGLQLIVLLQMITNSENSISAPITQSPQTCGVRPQAPQFNKFLNFTKVG